MNNLTELEQLARNSDNPESLAILANHRAWQVRITVARNSSTSYDTLRRLSSDPNPYVSEQAEVWLAERLATDAESGYR